VEKSSAIAALSALAQETRLDIFRILVEQGPDGLAAGEIGERLGLVSPTLSFHLNQLRYAALVTSRREGRSIIYAADYGNMNALLAYLTENCCKGRLQRCDQRLPASAPKGPKSPMAARKLAPGARRARRRRIEARS
jgi:ArsR family transcriptional regulator, arsenate/arsenite/antimonite-responsive transcriptional repressor